MAHEHYRKGYIHPQMKFLFYRNRQLSGDFYKCGMPILGAALFWGDRILLRILPYGSSGSRCGSSQFRGCRSKRCGLLSERRHFGATGIMVGNELGAGNLERGKAYGIRLMKISCVCGIAASLLMCIAAPVILHFVKLTPQRPPT